MKEPVCTLRRILMGATHRLGRRGVALGAAIAIVFGFAAGLLAVRWSAAEAAQPAVQRSGVQPRPMVPASDPIEPAAVPSTTRSPSHPSPLTQTCGDPDARVIRWRVAIEPGLDTTPRAFARGVADVLCHPRGWIAGERVAFRYDPDGAVLVRLSSPQQAERRCLALTGLSIRLMWSCASRSAGEVVLNADRWFEGSPSWPGGIARYRRMLVNHEMGHVLGHGHRGCGSPGSAAPVMMQQSKGLAGCRPNPWPTSGELGATR